jgi:hypothetical protein
MNIYDCNSRTRGLSLDGQKLTDEVSGSSIKLKRLSSVWMTTWDFGNILVRFRSSEGAHVAMAGMNGAFPGFYVVILLYILIFDPFPSFLHTICQNSTCNS